MNKDLIKKKYNEKINLINYYNKKYFDENLSEISDKDYDKLKKELIKLEKNYTFLSSENSPTSKVGYKPSKNFKK
jgi:DNA ligase (NAD+)